MLLTITVFWMMEAAVPKLLMKKKFFSSKLVQQELRNLRL
jgi:hypothetical protein